MSYEFRIFKDTNEIHIFEEFKEKSICEHAQKSRCKEISIYHKKEERKVENLRELSELNTHEAQGVAYILNLIGLNVCGICVSHLYRTQD